MSMPPPAEIGAPLAEVDTPALVIDLDAFERNLARMAERCAAFPRVRLRPHAKTHKSPIVALKQMALGAVGVCCQKVGEAEAMVRGGVPDVLVSNEVVGGRKLARLAALARHARIGVCVDDPGNVDALSAAAGDAGAELDVLVELDVGGGRCGVAPGPEAVELARRVADRPGLRFRGLQAYRGTAQHLRSHEERTAATVEAADLAAGVRDRLAAAGLACPVISGGGTGTWASEAASGVFTELQPGSYVFLDADYARNRGAEGEPFAAQWEHSLFVLATVMSAPVPGRAVVDAGHKAAAIDSGLPEAHGVDGVSYVSASDEHGTLEVPHNGGPALGDRILLIPGHCDPTVNLHDWYVGVRGGLSDGRVECLWPVAARGAMT